MIQDIDNYNKVFDIRNIDVTKDLGIDKIEGSIFFSVLREYQDEIVNETRCWPTSEIIVQRKDENIRIRWEWDDLSLNVKSGFALKNQYIVLCNKGICIEEEKGKFDVERFRFRCHLFPIPYIRINFPNPILDISVSRFNFENKKEILDKIWLKLGEYISSELIKLSVEKKGYELWRLITINMLQYHLPVDSLDDKIFKDIEFPLISQEGKLFYSKINEMNQLYFMPRIRFDIILNFEKIKEEYEKNWIYGECLLIKKQHADTEKSIETKILDVMYSVIKRNYYLREMLLCQDLVQTKMRYSIS